MEKLLWESVRGGQRGYKVWRQHPVGSFVQDFSVLAVRVGVDLDGEVHRDSTSRDADGGEALLGAGIRILRFTNDDVRTDLARVLAVIDAEIRCG